MHNNPGTRYFDRTIILLILALFMLVSPLTLIWSSARSPWYLVYVVWLGIIFLTYWIQKRRDRRDV